MNSDLPFAIGERSNTSGRSAGAGTRRSLYILAGLVSGLATGALIAGSDVAATVSAVAQPIGKLWIDALAMTVVPLVFALLVTGIAGAAEKAGSRVARHAMMWFGGFLVAACMTSALMTTLALASWPVPAEAGNLRSNAVAPIISSAGQWLDNIVPRNPIKAAADSAMVPLVVFALFFGFAVSKITVAVRDAILMLFDGLAQTMLVIVDWVLILAPLGVFALAIGVGITVGVGVASVLAHYMIVIIGACLLAIVLAYVAAISVGRVSLQTFGQAILPAQILAFSTQSSLASLPAMVRSADALNVERVTAGIVLPLSVSLFRMASAAANLAVAIYLANVHGVELGPEQLIVGALVAAVISVAAVGLPAQVSFFAVVGPVCIAMGVPLVMLPLLLAVETIPDMFRTVGNVTGGLAVTQIVARRTSKCSAEVAGLEAHG